MDDNKIKYNGSKLPATFYVHRDYRQPIDDTSIYSTYTTLQENLKDTNNKYYVGQVLGINNDNTEQTDYAYNTGMYYVNSYSTKSGSLTYTVERLMDRNDVKQYVSKNSQKLSVGTENTLTADGVEYTLVIDSAGSTGTISLKKYIAPAVSSFSFLSTKFDGPWGTATTDNSTKYAEYGTAYQIEVNPQNTVSYTCTYGTADICVLGITVNNTYIYGTSTNNMYKDTVTNKYCDNSTKVAYQYVSSDIAKTNISISADSSAYASAVTYGDNNKTLLTDTLTVSSLSQSAIIYVHNLTKDTIISKSCSIQNKVTLKPNYTFYAWNSTNTIASQFTNFDFAKGNNLTTSLPSTFSITTKSTSGEYQWLLVKKTFVAKSETATPLDSATGTSANESTILKWANNASFTNYVSWFYAGSVNIYETGDYYLYRSQNHTLSSTEYYLGTK